jgi:hypothetical protein
MILSFTDSEIHSYLKWLQKHFGNSLVLLNGFINQLIKYEALYKEN